MACILVGLLSKTKNINVFDKSFQAPLSAGMLAVAVLIFEPITAENGLLSFWSFSSLVSAMYLLFISSSSSSSSSPPSSSSSSPPSSSSSSSSSSLTLLLSSSSITTTSSLLSWSLSYLHPPLYHWSFHAMFCIMPLHILWFRLEEWQTQIKNNNTKKLNSTVSAIRLNKKVQKYFCANA